MENPFTVYDQYITKAIEAADAGKMQDAQGYAAVAGAAAQMMAASNLQGIQQAIQNKR